MTGTDPLPGKEPVPLAPPAEPITGDSHHHLIAPLIAHAAELGYSVEIRDLPEHGPGGWCDPKRRQIVVADGPANHQVRTLTPWWRWRIRSVRMRWCGCRRAGCLAARASLAGDVGWRRGSRVALSARS